MQGVKYNNDRDISLALIQIHEKSLHGVRNQRVFENKPTEGKSVGWNRSYAQVVQEKEKCEVQKNHKMTSVGKSRGRGQPEQPKKLFFTGVKESTSITEVWRTLKRIGRVKDIYMPNKKDKFGNRFGFVILTNNAEAQKLYLNKDNISIEGSKLVIEWARRFKKAQAAPVSAKDFQEKTNSKTSPQSQAIPSVSVELPVHQSDLGVIHLNIE